MSSRLVPALLILTLALAGCASVPTALAPVPDDLPDDPAAYPADAVHAMRGIVGHIQGRTVRGTRFSAGAHHALSNSDYDYPGFSLQSHRLLHYAVREDGPTGRYASGAVTLGDRYGRRAGLIYSTLYTLDDNGLDIDVARLASIYTATPAIRVFLVPKDKLPEPAATWNETYEAMQKLDEMPEGGLNDARPLDTHALAVFVLDRAEPRSDVQLSLDIPELARVLPIVHLGTKDYRDYHGWRVAIVQVEPAMQAGL